MMKNLFKLQRKQSTIKFSQLLILLIFYFNPLSAQNVCDCPNGGVILSNIGITNYSLQQLIVAKVLPENSYSGCLVLNGNLDIDTDYTFNSVIARFTGSSSITITNGSRLNLKSGNYSGCDLLWSGFIAENGSTIRMSDVAIEDATEALTLLDGSSFAAKDCLFKNNFRGIVVPPNNAGNSITLIPPFLINNTFWGGDMLLPGAASSFSYSGIELNDTSLDIVGYPNLFSNSNNTFRNMFNGIVMFNSDLLLDGATFQNMMEDTEGPFVPFSDHGIYAENSFITSFNNTYENLGFGIRVNNSTVNNFQDSYNNMRVGVEIASSMDGYSSLSNSYYSNYTEHGVAVYTSLAEDIIRNEFTNTFKVEDVQPTAITISNSIITNFVLNNHITLSPQQTGIDIFSSDNILLKENSVSFFSELDCPDPVVWSTGVRLKEAANNNIRNNIVAANPRIPSTAFDFTDSPRNNVECNTAQETVLGFTFQGLNCVGTDFKGNVMRNNLAAGLALTNTIIGGQEDRGNQWCNGSVASIINSDEAASRFTVSPGTPSIQCKFWPANNGTNWFIPINDSTPFQCGDIDTDGEDEDELGGRSAIEEEENYQNSNDLKVFPNPSNGRFTLSGDLVNTGNQITVRNLNGTIITQKIISEASRLNFDMDLSAGTYFVTIIDAKTGRLTSKRIVIQNL